jgi:hypothetical protein
MVLSIDLKENSQMLSRIVTGNVNHKKRQNVYILVIDMPVKMVYYGGTLFPRRRKLTTIGGTG